LIKMGSAFVSPPLCSKAHYTLAVYSSRECRVDMASGPAHSDRIYFSSWIGHWGSYAKGRENDLSNWYSELWFFSSSSSSSSLRIFCWFLLLFLFAYHGELVPTSYPSHAFSFWSHGGRNGGWENILELTFLDIELVSDMHNTQSRKY